MARIAVLVAAATIAATSFAQAKTEVVSLAIAGHLTRQHEPLAKMLNERQDEIVVTSAAPRATMPMVTIAEELSER